MNNLQIVPVVLINNFRIHESSSKYKLSKNSHDEKQHAVINIASSRHHMPAPVIETYVGPYLKAKDLCNALSVCREWHKGLSPINLNELFWEINLRKIEEILTPEMRNTIHVNDISHNPARYYPLLKLIPEKQSLKIQYVGMSFFINQWQIETKQTHEIILPRFNRGEPWFNRIQVISLISGLTLSAFSIVELPHQKDIKKMFQTIGYLFNSTIIIGTAIKNLKRPTYDTPVFLFSFNFFGSIVEVVSSLFLGYTKSMVPSSIGLGVGLISTISIKKSKYYLGFLAEKVSQAYLYVKDSLCSRRC